MQAKLAKLTEICFLLKVNLTHVGDSSKSVPSHYTTFTLSHDRCILRLKSCVHDIKLNSVGKSTVAFVSLLAQNFSTVGHVRANFHVLSYVVM